MGRGPRKGKFQAKKIEESSDAPETKLLYLAGFKRIDRRTGQSTSCCQVFLGDPQFFPGLPDGNSYLIERHVISGAIRWQHYLIRFS